MKSTNDFNVFEYFMTTIFMFEVYLGYPFQMQAKLQVLNHKVYLR